MLFKLPNIFWNITWCFNTLEGLALIPLSVSKYHIHIDYCVMDKNEFLERITPTMNRSMKKLKIGITIDVYDAVNGGVISTRRIVDELRKRGHEVYVFSTSNGTNPPDDPFFIPMKPFYVSVAKGIMKKLKMPLAKPIDALMRPLFKELDVVHSMFPFWLGYKSLQLAKAFHKPILTTFHIQVEHICKNIHFEAEWLTRSAYKLLIKKLYNRHDFVYCPAPLARQEVLKYGLKTPSAVLSNGVPPLFTPKPVPRPPALEGKFLILSVGRLSPEKSHKTIIEAIRQSQYKDRIQLLIFGEGPQRNHLLKQAADLPNPLQIQLVSPQELADYYNMADLYVHASVLETEGMAPLEASACGAPLLISDAPKSASGHFVIDQNSWFKHQNPQSLAQQIDYWAERPEALKQLGERYAQEAKKYRIEEVVNVLEQKYYELTKA